MWGSEVTPEALAKTTVFLVLPGPCLTLLPRSSFHASRSTHRPFVLKFSEPCSLKAVSVYVLLKEEIVTLPNILSWKIPWPEELGGLQSMG